MKSEGILSLTSPKIKGSINSSNTKSEISEFFKKNKFTSIQISMVESIFSEAKKNKFTIKIQYAK